MKKTILTCILLISACTNTPTIISFNDQSVGTYNPAAGSTSLQLKQDCSKIIGATRHIIIDEIELRIAGSADGRVLFVMSKPTLSPDTQALKRGANAVKNFLLSKGVVIIESKAIYGDNIIVGYHYTFNVDGYSYLKALTIKKAPVQQSSI
jgi:hypothetical protein